MKINDSEVDIPNQSARSVHDIQIPDYERPQQNIRVKKAILIDEEEVDFISLINAQIQYTKSIDLSSDISVNTFKKMILRGFRVYLKE